MSVRNLLLPLTAVGSWQQLSSLITTEQAANSASDLPPICNELDIINPETNADGSRLEITSDPVTFTPAYRLLKEEHQPFTSQCYNNQSTMDKWIRLVDEATGNPIDGDARVVINFA